MTWPTIKLGKCIDILSGFAFDSKKFSTDKGIKLIRIRDVVRGYSDTYYDGSFDKKYLVKKDDILIGMDGEFNRARWASEDALLNQRVCKISAKDNILNNDFLYHLLPKELKKIEDITPFVTVKHLSVKTINEIEIRLPPLAEQQRIAVILDKAELVKRKRELALKKLDKFAQSQFVKMFSEIKEYQVCKLKDLCELITKGTTPTTLDLKFEEHGIPFIRAQNIIDGKISFSKDALYISPETHNALNRSKIYPNDILISIAGTIGRSGVVGNEFGELNCNQAVAILRVNARVIPNFLRIWLESDFAKKQISSSTVTGVISNLSLSQIGSLEINLPSLEIQNKFLAFIDVMDKTREIFRFNLKQLEKLEASITNTFFKDKK